MNSVNVMHIRVALNTKNNYTKNSNINITCINNILPLYTKYRHQLNSHKACIIKRNNLVKTKRRATVTYRWKYEPPPPRIPVGGNRTIDCLYDDETTIRYANKSSFIKIQQTFIIRWLCSYHFYVFFIHWDIL